MSLLRTYVNGSWVEAGLTIEAPIRRFDGTRWVELDSTVEPPTPDPGGGGEVPVSDFESLPGLQMFVDAADPETTGTAPANGSAVRTFKSKAGTHQFTSPVVEGETAEQLAARAPDYYAETDTEPAFLRFRGSAQRLNAQTAIPTSGALSIYVVARVAGLGYGTLFGVTSSKNTLPGVVLDCGQDGRTRAFRRTDDNAMTMTQQPLLPSVWRVFSFTSANYSSASFRANERLAAGAAATTSNGVTTTDIMSLGNRVSQDAPGSIGGQLIGDIAAVVAFDEFHDPTTRQAVEQQLATRYKIVLPSQGGTLDGPSERVVAALKQRSVEYGIPDTHEVTGLELPGFHNTGPDKTLQSSDFEFIEGTITTSSDGEVISRKWISGNIVIKHADVVVRDVYQFSTSDPKIDTRQQPYAGANVKLHRIEQWGKEDDGGTGVGYIRYDLEESYLHDGEDGARLNKATNVRRSLMGLQSNGYLTSDERLHTDSVQSNGGDNEPGVWSEITDNTLIGQRHNGSKGNSAVILATEGSYDKDKGGNQGSPLRRVRVKGNYLAGGSYTIYVKTPYTGGSPGPMESIEIIDNVFRGVGEGGHMALHGDLWLPKKEYTDTFLTMTGNVRQDGKPFVINRSDGTAEQKWLSTAW